MPNENAEKLLCQRYYQPGEDWPGLAHRVGHAVGAHRDDLQRNLYQGVVYDMEFLPNSPCLMGAGTPLQQIAACFVLPVEDSMERIMDALKDAALIHKSGGGTGFSFSALRATNQPVSSTQGVASGPVSFMKMFDAVTEQIKQGGRRKGANMGILRVDHPDIRRFLRAKTCEDNLNNFNLSVGVTRELMQSETIRLRDPATKETVEEVYSEEILDLIARQAWRNGEPGVVFLDHVNLKRPANQRQMMEATNPCGEFPGVDYEPCILGSINLTKMLTSKGVLDFKRLERVAMVGTMFLDDAIDVNNYPLQAVEKVAKRNRKIGLGIMGLHSLLMRIGLPYDSIEGREWAALIMNTIQRASHETSAMLADLRGEPPGVNGWRNMTTTAIAPTGSLSLITGSSMGCEPKFALAQERNLSDGQRYVEYCPEYERILQKESAKDRDGLNEHLQDVFKTAQEIHWADHLRMQAELQKYTDNGVSKTINMPNSSTVQDVREAIRLGWELGCKGFTLYRDGSRDEQPLCELCG